MLSKQKFIVVGSVDPNGLCNISPRTSSYYSKDAIYWLDFFKHKSQGNLKTIPLASIAVFDKKELKDPSSKAKLVF